MCNIKTMTTLLIQVWFCPNHVARSDEDIVVLASPEFSVIFGSIWLLFPLGFSRKPHLTFLYILFLENLNKK